MVVLGHGAGGNHAIWFQQVPVFEREHRVITWDQRGFGNSTNRNGLANPHTATKDLLAILDHFEIERAHIVGQSMGGWAAMGLAVAHGDRVRSLVLADTLAGIADRRLVECGRVDSTTRRRVQPHRARQRVLHPQPGTCAPVPQDRRPAPGAARRPVRDAEEPGQGHLHRRPGRRTRRAGALHRGHQDEIFPPALIDQAAGRVPGAEVERIEGAGHSPYFEQPGVWNALVQDFWFPRT